MKKRLLSALLAFSMLFSVFPGVMPIANAADGAPILKSLDVNFNETTGEIDSITVAPDRSDKTSGTFELYITVITTFSVTDTDGYEAVEVVPGVDDTTGYLYEVCGPDSGSVNVLKGDSAASAKIYIKLDYSSDAPVTFAAAADGSTKAWEYCEYGNENMFNAETLYETFSFNYDSDANDPTQAKALNVVIDDDWPTNVGTLPYTTYVCMSAAGYGLTRYQATSGEVAANEPDPGDDEKITAVELPDISTPVTKSAAATTSIGDATITSTDNGATTDDIPISYSWTKSGGTAGGAGSTAGFPTNPGKYTVTATIGPLSSSSDYTLDDAFEVTAGTGWGTVSGNAAAGWTVTANVVITDVITAVDLTLIGSQTTTDTVPTIAVTAPTDSTVELDGSVSWSPSVTTGSAWGSAGTYVATATVKVSDSDVYSFDSTALAKGETTTNGWEVDSYSAGSLTLKKSVSVSTATTTLDSISVSNTVEPADGAALSTINFTSSDNTTISSVTWKKGSSDVANTVKFEPGETYTATITVVPDDTYVFPSAGPTVTTSGISGLTPAAGAKNSSSAVITATVTIPKRKITSVDATITAPTLKAAVPTQATGITVSDGTNTENVDDTTFSTGISNTLTYDGKTCPQAGNGDYTVVFDVAAPTGYEFDTTTKITTSDITIANGWTATAVTVAADKVTITAKYDEIAKELTSLSSTPTIDIEVYTDTAIAASDLDSGYKATLGFNDGSEDEVAYGSFSSKGLSLVYVDKDAAAPTTDVSDSLIDFTSSTAVTKDVYLKYTGTSVASALNPVTSGSNKIAYVKAGAAAVVYAPMTAGTVSFAYPAPGVAPSTTISVGDSTKYSAELDWDTTDTAFKYGQTYTATVTVTANNDDGYVWDDNDNAVTITASDSLSVGSDKAETVTATTEEAEVTYTFTIGAAPTVTLKESTDADYDYYDPAGDGSNHGNGDTVVYTIAKTSGGADITDISSVTVNNVKLTNDVSNTYYTVTGTGDSRELTITTAGLNYIAEQGYKPAKTSASDYLPYTSTAASWAVKVNFVAGDVTAETDISAMDTTPYVKFTDGTGTTIHENTTSGTAVTTGSYIALKKSTDYTYATKITATGHNKFDKWTVTENGTATNPTANPLTRQFVSGFTDITSAIAADEGVKLTLAVSPLAAATKAGTDGGTISVVRKTGESTTEAMTASDGKYTLYSDETYIVTAKPNTHFAFADSDKIVADDNVSGSPSATAGDDGAYTYTFSPDGAGNITITANFVELPHYTFKFAAEKHASADAYDSTYQSTTAKQNGTVKSSTSGATGSSAPNASDITLWSDSTETYTISQVANDHAKVYDSEKWKITGASALSGFTPASADTFTLSATTVNTLNTASLASGSEITITAEYAPKTLPTIETSATVQTHTKGSSTNDISYSYKNGDYGEPAFSISPTTIGITADNSQTYNASTDTAGVYKFTSANIESDSAKAGSYTLTFGWSLDSTTGYTRDFKINAPESVTAVTLPTGLKHGNDFTTFSFTVTPTDDDAVTYTYTVGADSAAGSWKKGSTPITGADEDAIYAQLPNATVYVYNGSDDIVGTNASPVTLRSFINDYIETYAGVNRHVRRNRNSVANTLADGDTVKVILKGGSATGTLNVGKKDIALTVTNDKYDADEDWDKVYNGNADVLGTLSYSVTNNSDLVDSDSLTGAYTIAGKYYQSGSTDPTTDTAQSNHSNGSDLPILFTAAAVSGNDDADNYNPTFTAGAGAIFKRNVHITDINNVPDATLGTSSSFKVTDQSQTVSVTNANTNEVITYDAATEANASEDATDSTKYYKVVNGDTLTIKYNYEYKSKVVGTTRTTIVDITDAEVSAGNSDGNYVVTIDTMTTAANNPQLGQVNAGTIYSLAITNPTKNEYYYSDAFDWTGVKVTVRWNNASGDTDEYDLTKEADRNALASLNLKVTWKDASGDELANETVLNVPDYNEKLYVYKTDDTSMNAESSNKVVVNPLPVTITATGTMERAYNKLKTYTLDTITYAGVLDETGLTAEQKTAYAAKLAADVNKITATAAYLDSADAGTRTAEFTDITFTMNGGVDASNYIASGDIDYSAITPTITKKDITITEIIAPSVKQHAKGEALTDTVTETTNGTGDTTNGKGITINGLEDGDTVEVTYGYAYTEDQAKTAGAVPYDLTSTPKKGVAYTATVPALTADTNAVNKNYKLADTDPYPALAKGNVVARDVKSITVTSPTQFTTSQTTPLTYGDSDLDMAGLIVSVVYEIAGSPDETERYVWKSYDSVEGTTTWTLGAEGKTGEDVTSVPFDLKWSGDSAVPVEGELMPVSRDNTYFVASMTKNDGVTPVTSPAATTVRINKKEITGIIVEGMDTAITKVYDGDANLLDGQKPTGYKVYYKDTDGADTVGNTELTVVAKDGTNPAITWTYDKADYHTATALKKDISNLELDGTDVANYKLPDTITYYYNSAAAGDPANYVTFEPTGAIDKRPIRVISVSKVPTIDLYQTGDGIKSTAKAITGTDNAAVFGPLTDADIADGTYKDWDKSNSDVITVSGTKQKPIITYKYLYTDNKPAGDVTNVTISDIALETDSVSSNYVLVNDTITNHAGHINADNPQKIEITTVPSQMYLTTHVETVQYGDTLDLTGLKVVVTYANYTATYTFKEVDGGVNKWTETIDGTDTDILETADGFPFTFTAPYGDEAVLTSNNGTKITGVKEYVATLKITDGAAEAEQKSKAYLKINPRQVKITASGSPTKMYDGTKTYTNPALGETGHISLALAPVAASFTLASDIEIDTSSATYTYSDANVATASKTVTVGGLALKATSAGTGNAENYTIVDASSDYVVEDAAITQRPIKIATITNKKVDEVNQHASGDAIKGNATATITAADKTEATLEVVADTTYDIPEQGDAVTIKFKWAYNDTSKIQPELGENKNVDITVPNGEGEDTDNYVSENATNNSNYSITYADIPSVQKEPKKRSATGISVVANPTQFTDSADDFYKDKLNIEGLKVKVDYPSAASETYYAKSVDTTTGVTTWVKTVGEDATEIPVTSIPFTMSWGKNTATAGDYENGTELTVDKHDTNYIHVSSTEASNIENDGAAITIKPLVITKIEAVLKADANIDSATKYIRKEYNADTDLGSDDKSKSNTDKLTYKFYRTVTTADDTEIVDAADYAEIIAGFSTTPVFEDKNASSYTGTPSDTDADKALDFEDTAISTTSTKNYKLADGLKPVTDVKGLITKRPVTISAIYIPVAYKDDTDTFTITGAKVGTSASNANTVVASGFIGDEGKTMTFDYKVKYSSVAATGDSIAVNYETIADANSVNGHIKVADTATPSNLNNYTYTEPTTLTGEVSSDKVEEINPPVAPEGLNEYEFTHGDPFTTKIVGLTVVIKTSSEGEKTYTVANKGDTDNPDYAWQVDGSDADLPAGVSITAGGVSLTTNAELNAAKAHYTNMGPEGNIGVSVSASGQETKTSTAKFKVKQKQLTATMKSVDSTDHSTAKTFSKYYDTTTDLKSTNLDGAGVELGYDFGTGEVQSFSGTPDKVTLKFDGEYVSADAGTASPYTVQIKATNISLDGDDHANYIVPATIDNIDGVIKPYVLTVTAIDSGVVPNTYYKVNKTGTGLTTKNYTSNISSSDTALYAARPNIKFNYEYSAANLAGLGDVDVPIDTSFDGTGDDSTIEIADTTTNFVLADNGNAMTAPGKVLSNIASIEVSGNTITKMYGDTLTKADLRDAGLKATITYASSGGTLVVDYPANDTDEADDTNPWNVLGLDLDDTTKALLAKTALSHVSDNGKKIGVTKSGLTPTGGIDLTVNARPVLLDVSDASTLTTVYNGTVNLYDNATDNTSTTTKDIALKVADDNSTSGATHSGNIYDTDGSTTKASGEAKYYGLTNSDTLESLGLETLKFQFTTTAGKNVGTGKALEIVGSFAFTSGNKDEYAPVLVAQTGSVTARTITVAPKFEMYYLASATDGTDDQTDTATNVVGTTTSRFTLTNAVSADLEKLNISYAVKFNGSLRANEVTAWTDATAGTYTYTTNASLSGDEAGNYTIANGTPQIKVTKDTTEGLTIVNPPTALAAQHYYGESLSLDGFEVSVRKSGVTTVYKHNGTKWTKNDGQDISENEITAVLKGVTGADLTKLSVDYDNKVFTVSAQGFSEDTADAAGTLKVAARPITLTAAVSDAEGASLNKVYDGSDTLAASNIKWEVASNATPALDPILATGDSVDTSAITWKYYKADGTAADANVENGKQLKYTGAATIKNGDDTIPAKEYAITYVNTLTGNITPFKINITPVSPASTFLASNYVKGSEAYTKEITSKTVASNSDANGTTTIPSDFDTSKLKLYAAYTATHDSTEIPAGSTAASVSGLALTVKYNEAEVDKVDGSDVSTQLPNYILYLNPTTANGNVVNKVITNIKITTAPTNNVKSGTSLAGNDLTQEYVHGDKLDLSGVVIKVTYDEDSNKFHRITKNTTYVDGQPDDDTWKVEYTIDGGTNFTQLGANEGDNITTANLPVKLNFVPATGESKAITAATTQFVYKDYKDTYHIEVDNGETGNDKLTADEQIKIEVNQKEITKVEADYAIKEGSTKRTHADITKPYDGNGKIADAQQAYIAYTADDADLATIDGTKDTVTIKPLSGAASYKPDSEGHYNAKTEKPLIIDKDKLTIDTTTGAGENYKFKQNSSNKNDFTLMSTDVTPALDISLFDIEHLTGDITKLKLAYDVTIDAITTGDARTFQVAADNVTLSSSSEDSVVSGETIAPKVMAHYGSDSPATTVNFTEITKEAAATAADNTNYYYLDDTDYDETFPYMNYEISLADTATGAVSAKSLTGLKIEIPDDKKNFNHGDTLDLTGTKVTVSYGTTSAPDDKVYTFEPTTGENADKPWILGKGTAGETRVASPDDVKVVWNGTETDIKTSQGNDIRLSDTDKGTLAGDGKAKTLTIAAVPTAGGTTAQTDTITLSPAKLKAVFKGDIWKLYDGTVNVAAADKTNLLTTAELDGRKYKVGSSTEYEDVSIEDATFEYTSENGDVTTATGDPAKHPQLTVKDVVLTGTQAAYYEVAADGIDKTATTGEIRVRTIKINGVKNTMNASVGVEDGTLTVGSEDYIQADDSDGIAEGQDIKVDIPYHYTSRTEGPTTVQFNKDTDTPAAKKSDTNEDYAKNYNVVVDIPEKDATISSGAVAGIDFEFVKTSYTHGDEIDFTGAKVTLTYNNGNGNTSKKEFAYDAEAKKWTLTNYVNDVAFGTPLPGQDLPAEVKIKVGGADTVTSPTDENKTNLRRADNEKEVTAVYTSGETTLTADDKFELKVDPKTINVTVSVKDGETISQTYEASPNLNEENLAKLAFTPDADIIAQLIPADQATVTVTKGTLAASFVTQDVSEDPIGIKVDAAYIALSDPDSYKINYVDNAEGLITKRDAKIIANSVPPYSAETGAVVDITDYRTENFVGGHVPTVTWKGTYDLTTDPISVDLTTEHDVDEDTKKNYNVTFEPDTMTGSLSEKIAEKIEIVDQPKFVTDAKEGDNPHHGDTIEEAGGLEGFKIKVTYNTGEEVYTYHDGKWNKEEADGTLTELPGLPENTVITWNNTNNTVTEQSVIRRDSDNGNTITVSVANKPELDKATTDAVNADPRPVVITAQNPYSREYNGTTEIPENSGITYAIEGLAEGDNVTVSATPAFKDAHVDKDGNEIVFTNVALVNNEDGNYVIQQVDGEDIAPVKGTIKPAKLKLNISAPVKTQGQDTAVSVTGATLDPDASGQGSYTVAEGYQIYGDDKVTIAYEGNYNSTENVTTTDNPAIVTATTGPAIVGEGSAATDYELVDCTITGSVGKKSSGGGGGGGGGSSNTLTIKYKNADGSTGESVASKLTISEDNEPITLTAAFSLRMSDPTVVWTSSNEKVLTVDENGVITFVGEGEAVVTATSKTNKSLKDTVTITVTPVEATPAPTTNPSSGGTATPTPAPTPYYEKTDSLITKEMLNPYIVGYDDYVFGPELPISREELATIFARLIANNLYMDQDYDTSFPDVPEKWSKPYIGYLEGFGVVTGYEDGSFRPENYITRAEMAVMMAKAEGYDISGYLSSDEVEFPDVDEGYSAWAVKAIKILSDMGIMEGYTDGTFRPGQPITRAETVATVNRVLADMEVADYEVLPSDVTDAHWAYNDIVFAMNHRILKDAAADPNRFIWSEQFDENMIVNTERVEGETREVTPDGTEENNSSDTSESADAVAPEATETPDGSGSAKTEN